MRTALVTGAGGFIGSRLCEMLLDDGWSVRALVRYTSHDQRGALVHSTPEVLSHIDIRTGDLRDPDAVRRVMTGVDAVFHLGAIIAIPFSYLNPREVVDTNVMGTLNVLEAARDLGTQRVVHTSTSEVYGTALTAAITETHVLQAQSPYSASKVAADKLAESFHRSYGLPVVTLRPFNTFGPRQSPRAVIPTILMQALAGTSVRLGSLSPTRDFTFVDDTARGFILAATAPGIEGQVIHLGTGREVSVGDIVELAADIVGHPLEVIETEGRLRPVDSEVMRLLSDPSKASETLGWKATIDLEEGLRRTAAWLSTKASWFQLSDHAI